MSTMNLFDMTDVWNAGATTFTAVKMNVTDTASAAGSLLIDMQVGGASQFRVDKGGVVRVVDGSKANPALQFSGLPNGGAYYRAGTCFAVASGGIERFHVGASGAIAVIDRILIGPGDLSTISPDIEINRDAADTLALRRNTSPQALRIYNTFTDASNFQRLAIGWSGNRLQIGVDGAGTGAQQPVDIWGSGVVFKFGNGGGSTAADYNATRWNFNQNVVFQSDNAFDIGASGANRPRNIYMGSWLRMASVAVASLPSAATAGASARMFATDATAPVFGAIVAGGGATLIPVYSDGTNWRVG